MIIFLLGFIAGMIFLSLSLLLAYNILIEVLFRYGKPIARKIEHSFSVFDQQLKDQTQIIYPNYTEAVFNKEGSTLEDNLS